MKRFFQHLSFFVIFMMMNLFIYKMQVPSVMNSAFIFGLFNETSHFVRIVCNCVFLGIVMIIASYFYAFLSKELTTLRWGMTFLLTGFAGNALEKLILGYVRDYVSLLNHFYFNLNDVIQIIGLAIVVREIFNKQKIIWFPDPLKRKKLFIYKDVQVPITTKVLGLFFIGSLTQGILAIALLFPQLKRGTQDVQVLFILCLVILNFALLPLIGRFLLKELLRCMGPVYAMERYLKDEKAIETPLKFRSTDHFRSLEESFNQFVEKNVKSK